MSRGEDLSPSGAPLLAASPVGRRFVGRRKVRLGDVDRGGRLRLDALTRYTQDVSDDDTTDAGLAAEPGWVVRSTVVDELRPAELAETITCETFCSALGKRWAERRLSISGDRGARYEVATLWVCIDQVAARPAPLTEEFLGLYAEAAAGRTVSAKLQNPKPTTVGSEELDHHIWHVRAADYDVYNHVNNAAFWAVVEQWAPPGSGPRRIRMEYGQGVSPTPAVPVVVYRGDGGDSGSVGDRIVMWWLDGEGGDLDAPTLASVSIVGLPEDLYPDIYPGLESDIYPGLESDVEPDLDPDPDRS